jgi:hypothetical protein
MKVKVCRETFWFGCERCQYAAPEEEASNWHVFIDAQCPKCGKPMRLVYGISPEKEKENECQYQDGSASTLTERSQNTMAGTVV